DLIMKRYQTTWKHVFALTMAIVFFTAKIASAQGTWKADPAHSKMTLSITHLGISDILGLFQQSDASITASEADFSDAVFALTVDAASINTEVQKRDDHLRSADFFDVEKFPTITFKSTGIKKTGKNRYKLSGD